jgi:hypothetical protein
MFGMTGWKSKASGIGQVLGGISLALIGFGEEVISFEKIAAGWAMIMLGLGTLGIAHKVEKAGDATVVAVEKPPSA